MKTKTPHTIRSKLLVWFLTTTTLMFLLLGVLVGAVIWRVLLDQIDHHLHTVIMESEQVVNTFPSAERNNLLRAFAVQPGMTVVILANDGFPIFQVNSPDVSSPSLIDFKLLQTLTPTKANYPTHFNVNNIRFATQPIQLPEGPGILAIGYSLKVVQQTFQQLVIIIIFMFLLALSLIIYGIQTLLSRYLQPLEVVAQEAKTISHSHDLSFRISPKQETVELISLTHAINSMLERLATFFQTEHQFFSDTAHTLKTPLAVTKSYLETLPGTKENTLVLQQVDQAAETIQDLILISRMNSNEKVRNETVSVSVLMNELVEITSVLALDKKQKVVTSIQAGISMHANAALLRRALSNVIFNAIHYTPRHGTIQLSLLGTDEHIEIKISDSGIGIPAHEQDLIFNRFYRGSNVKKTKGTGLGLAMVKAIVEAYHGTVSIGSRLGHGTQVTIIFNR